MRWVAAPVRLRRRADRVLPVDEHARSADHLCMDPQDEQQDSHAVARERRAAKRRHGMQVSGRSTKTVLPETIARRGREADARLQGLRPTAEVRPAVGDADP